mgnify:FL=1|tara:strand:+ start:1067 stop:1879 length:813 start_codon:yes stop_codon:yes gene_type:complete
MKKHFWLKLKFIFEYSTHLQTDNNPPLKLIFKFIHELDKKDFKKVFKKFNQTDISKKIFNQDVAVLDKIMQGKFKPKTFGYEFQAWLKKSEGAVDIFKFSYPGKDNTKLGKFFKETIMQHDLIHFLNGYDTTPLAEVGVLSFNLAKEWRESYATILYSSFFMSIRNTFLPSKYPSGVRWYLLLKYSPIAVYLRVVNEGWKRGKKSPWLLTIDWEKYLHVDLKKVKKELLLENDPKYWLDVQPIWKKTLKRYKEYAKEHSNRSTTTDRGEV